MTKKELAKIITSIISDNIHSLVEMKMQEDMYTMIDTLYDGIYELDYLSSKLYSLVIIDENNVDRLAKSLKITYHSYFK